MTLALALIWCVIGTAFLAACALIAARGPVTLLVGLGRAPGITNAATDSRCGEGVDS